MIDRLKHLMLTEDYAGGAPVRAANYPVGHSRFVVGAVTPIDGEDLRLAQICGFSMFRHIWHAIEVEGTPRATGSLAPYREEVIWMEASLEQMGISRSTVQCSWQRRGRGRVSVVSPLCPQTLVIIHYLGAIEAIEATRLPTRNPGTQH